MHIDEHKTSVRWALYANWKPLSIVSDGVCLSKKSFAWRKGCDIGLIPPSKIHSFLKFESSSAFKRYEQKRLARTIFVSATIL